MLLPVTCYRGECNCLGMCIAMAVIATGGLFVVLAVARELKLQEVRLKH